MFSQLEIAIHQFAKRQMTWFRGMERTRLYYPLDGRPVAHGRKISFCKVKTQRDLVSLTATPLKRQIYENVGPIERNGYMSVEPDKWGVIYNPKAGTRKVQKRWKEIKAYMDSKGVSYDYVQSEGFGSVERLAGILANNGYRTIIVVGGDGALNDAINGIMLSNAEDKENIAIGIIPNGIGNDFAKYWEMSSEYKEAVDCIINNRRRKIDVGTCYYYDDQKHMTRYFLNAIYIGLGARIVQISDGTRRFWGIRELSFAASMFLLLFERKLYRTHLCINGEHIRGRIMTVCVGSARGYGLTPSAVPYNGWLDVSVIYRPELIQLFSGMWMLLQGRILNHKMVKPYRTRKVKVLRAQNASVSLDGRILDRHFPLKLRPPEAITLIIPN